MVKSLPIVPSAKAGTMADAPAGPAWREQRPVINGCCTQSRLCALFCPQGALKEEGDHLVVDLKLCDGCGICAVECPDHAIRMVPEYTGNRGIFPLKEGK